jgi:hypothetical protein
VLRIERFLTRHASAAALSWLNLFAFLYQLLMRLKFGDNSLGGSFWLDLLAASITSTFHLINPAIRLPLRKRIFQIITFDNLGLGRIKIHLKTRRD